MTEAFVSEPDEAIGPAWASLEDRWVVVTGAARGLAGRSRWASPALVPT